MDVRERRKRLKLTQVELAELIGITQGYLSEIERGKYTPRDWVLERLERIEKSSPKAA